MKGWEALKALEEGNCIFCPNMPKIFYRQKGAELVAVNVNDPSQEFEDTRINGKALRQNNWEIYEEPHNFIWALEQIQAGKRVRRRCWRHRSYLSKEGFNGVDRRITFVMGELLETNDWVIYQPENGF